MNCDVQPLFYTIAMKIAIVCIDEYLWNSIVILILKYDVGMMIFADKRYQRHDKRSKLPGWITAHLRDSHLNLSTDMLLHVARNFMRSMAQPTDASELGKSLLSECDINALAQNQ